jgi:hypothetical protein
LVEGSLKMFEGKGIVEDLDCVRFGNYSLGREPKRRKTNYP